MRSPRHHADDAPEVEGLYRPVAPAEERFEWGSDAVAPPAYVPPSAPEYCAVFPTGNPVGGNAPPEEEEEDDADGPGLQPVQQSLPPPVYYPYAATLAQKERGWHADLEEGYVYLKVFRGACPSGNSLVKATLKGASKKEKDVESKVVKKSSTPEFHQEFVFAIPPISGIKSGILLEFQAKKLIGAKTFGSISLGIDNIRKSPTFVRTVDLGKSSLDIVTAFAPINVDVRHYDEKNGVKAPAAEALEGIRIVTERKVYFAGERVSGIAFIHVRGQAKEVYALKLKAKGETRYHATHQETTTDSEGRTTTRTVHDCRFFFHGYEDTHH